MEAPACNRQFVGKKAALQLTVHHESINCAESRVHKRAGQPADDFELQTLPQPYRALVGADDEIKLHSAEAAGSGVLEGVQAHRTGDAAAAGPRCGHVTAIGDMCAAAFLIRSQIIRADNFAIFFRDENFVSWRVPVCERVRARHFARKSVGLSGANHRLKNSPDRVVIRFRCLANFHERHQSISTRSGCRIVRAVLQRPRDESWRRVFHSRDVGVFHRGDVLPASIF